MNLTLSTLDLFSYTIFYSKFLPVPTSSSRSPRVRTEILSGYNEEVIRFHV